MREQEPARQHRAAAEATLVAPLGAVRLVRYDLGAREEGRCAHVLTQGGCARAVVLDVLGVQPPRQHRATVEAARRRLVRAVKGVRCSRAPILAHVAAAGEVTAPAARALLGGEANGAALAEGTGVKAAAAFLAGPEELLVGQHGPALRAQPLRRATAAAARFAARAALIPRAIARAAPRLGPPARQLPLVTLVAAAGGRAGAPVPPLPLGVREPGDAPLDPLGGAAVAPLGPFEPRATAARPDLTSPARPLRLPRVRHAPLARPLAERHPAATQLALQLRVAVWPQHAAVGHRVDVAAASPHTSDHVGLLGGLAALAALAAARVLAHLARVGQVRVGQVRCVVGARSGRWCVWLRLRKAARVRRSPSGGRSAHASHAAHSPRASLAGRLPHVA